jgi:hypothetical protein
VYEELIFTSLTPVQKAGVDVVIRVTGAVVAGVMVVTGVAVVGVVDGVGGLVVAFGH